VEALRSRGATEEWNISRPPRAYVGRRNLLSEGLLYGASRLEDRTGLGIRGFNAFPGWSISWALVLGEPCSHVETKSIEQGQKGA
jgi:hypothetical protein